VPRLRAKNDLDGLIWAATYKKDAAVRSQARAALRDLAPELVRELQDLLRAERLQSGALGRRTLRNYPRLQLLQDGLVAAGEAVLDPLLRSFAATYRGDSTEFAAYREVLWRLDDVDLSARLQDPDPAVRELIADAISVRAQREDDA